MFMKKISLLAFVSALLAFAGCIKIEGVSDMEGFTGSNVQVGDKNGVSGNLKLLILNEGAFPGASTLDVLDFAGKKYYQDIFGQANPDVQQGLGNTGNDIEIAGSRIWLAMNASNKVIGINMFSFKLEVDVELPSPRCLLADDDYLYVTSYGAAIYGAPPTAGTLYRINLKDPKDVRSIMMGYQPEGIAIENGKIYVANSGGYNAVKDNRVTVIDQATFTSDTSFDLPVSNLNMIRKAFGKLWISTYGEWSETYVQTAPASLVSLSTDGTANVIEGVHASKITECEGTIYAIGNQEEMTGGYDWCLYKVNTETHVVEKTRFAGTDLGGILNPYCILVNPLTMDIIIADAKFDGDSTLWCFDKNLNEKWSVKTGVGTGHLLLYQM